VEAQLLKVRIRMGICLRGPKLHAKFMVAVWGIKIFALKVPVQWRWSYTILHFPQKINPHVSFFVVAVFHLFPLSPTKSGCFWPVFCHQKWVSHNRGWVWVIRGWHAAMVYMQPALLGTICRYTMKSTKFYQNCMQSCRCSHPGFACMQPWFSCSLGLHARCSLLCWDTAIICMHCVAWYARANLQIH